MGKFHKAVLSDESIWHAINCQTALGRTEAILKLLKDTPLRVLIAVPTNKLKREVYERAKEMGIYIIVSPSLHELKDDLPDEVWDDIETLYDAGKSPMPRLNKAIDEDDLECTKLFKQYKRELDEFDNNIPALCSATYFCYRKSSAWESDLDEDCVSFIKPMKFQQDTKYIMLSATADKDVCEYCIRI